MLNVPVCQRWVTEYAQVKCKQKRDAMLSVPPDGSARCDGPRRGVNKMLLHCPSLLLWLFLDKAFEMIHSLQFPCPSFKGRFHNALLKLVKWNQITS